MASVSLKETTLHPAGNCVFKALGWHQKLFGGIVVSVPVLCRSSCVPHKKGWWDGVMEANRHLQRMLVLQGRFWKSAKKQD